MAVAIAVTLALAGACGIGPGHSGSDAGLGGMGLPRQQDGETYPGLRRELHGPVEVAPDGCLQIGIDGHSHFVIWPRGSELADVVLLANGDTLRPGDEVTATGAPTTVEPLVADRKFLLGACDRLLCAGL